MRNSAHVYPEQKVDETQLWYWGHSGSASERRRQTDFRSAIHYFLNTKSGVSAYLFLARSEQVVQFVPFNRRAYHYELMVSPDMQEHFFNEGWVEKKFDGGTRPGPACGNYACRRNPQPVRMDLSAREWWHQADGGYWVHRSHAAVGQAGWSRDCEN